MELESLTSTHKMHLAIANWIHCKGLAFSTADCPLFNIVIQMAQRCSSNYKPPLRNDVGGQLLDMNFETVRRNIIGK